MMFPESWEFARISVVCDINPRLQQEDRPNESTEVTFVPMSAVDESIGIILSPEKRKFGEVSKGYTSFTERDVLFAKVTPCMENGKAAIANNLLNGLGFGSTEFHVLRPTDVILPEFLFHFIRQQVFRKWAASSFVGTGGLQRVPPDFFKRASIPLPTIPEQQRIVDILKQAETTLQAKQSVNDQIDQLVQTAYWEHFNDWYTTEGLREPVRISDYVADSQYGVSEAMAETGSRIVLRMNSITTSGWLNLTDFKYADLSPKDIEATELKNGDLLFNRTNSRELVGKCALWRGSKGPFSFASYLVRLRLKDGMLPEYLWATLNSAYGKYRLFNAAKQAVSMANISPTDLGRITVPLPPENLQEKFAELIKEIEQLREKMLFRLDSFHELQALVTQNALLGELTENWRKANKEEIEAAAVVRDTLLSERGFKLKTATPEPSVPTTESIESLSPARQWIVGELSGFQRQVLAAFLSYPEQPLIVEDENRVYHVL